MRKFCEAFGVVGLVAVIVAAMILQACSTQQQSSYQRVPQSQPGTWVSGAIPQQSMGLSTAVAPDGRYRDVPRIDLQRALSASQGGGGNVRSPFRGENGLESSGAVKLNDDQEFRDEDWGRVFLLDHPKRLARERGEAAPRTEVVLHPGEELWVIERTYPRTTRADDDRPGCGSLMTRRDIDGATQEVPVPLAHTSVSAHIDGYISTVNVKQQFHNPFDSKIEALYVFPLPEDAAVSDFLMTVGSRTIRGIIREREQAEKIYENARRQGYVASLMTQDRPNVFTQAVANIEPGNRIDIDIAYFHTLGYRDGAFEFVFPMVVGPRFNPPWTASAGTGVGAVGYGAPGQSGQQTEVQYLRPEQRTASDISVSIDINAGVGIESLESPSHSISVEHDGAMPSRAKVTLARGDTIPNKDFVLRYRVAGNAVKSAMLTQGDGRNGGYFSMLLVPPSDLAYIERGPVEVVFVIDCSGSMEGEPLAQAKASIEHALARLDVDDTFQIINFSDSASTLGGEPLKASRRNIERGLSYVRSLSAGGGTMMMNGVRAALDMPRERGRTRFVCFLTDGFIGNDPEVLGCIRERIGESRIMSVGIGSAPNRYLLEGMARLGRGAAAYVGPGDKPQEIMDLFLDRIAHVALTDLAIDWSGLDVSDVYPKRLPDLYVGRPVMITGRYRGAITGPVKISGRAGRERLPITVPITCEDRPDTKLGAIWARKKIEELSDKATSDNGPRLETEIKRMALDFGLMSSFTAFVAVDSMTRTSGAFGTTVTNPVPVPQGTRYETTVTGGARGR